MCAFILDRYMCNHIAAHGSFGFELNMWPEEFIKWTRAHENVQQLNLYTDA